MAEQTELDPVNYEKIQEIRDRLQELGVVAIIWTRDDFPGTSDEQKQERLEEYAGTLEDISTELGNRAISDWFPSEDVGYE